MNFIVLSMFIMIFTYIFIEYLRLWKIKSKYNQIKEYNRNLLSLNDSLRGFKHDFSNILNAIGGYIYANDMEGLKAYYSSLKTDCNKLNSLNLLNPDVINNPAIYSVLSEKYNKADEYGIIINLDIFMDLNKLNINTYEFTRIFGILMDNAIEASKECSDKIINLRIYKDSKSNRQVLYIENSYSDKKVDTETIYVKGFSGKANHTGLGLWEVRQILKKHSNLNLYTTKDDKFFKQQFEIY